MMKIPLPAMHLAIGAAIFVPAAANASITINVVESGGNLVATASGSLNLTGLTPVDLDQIAPALEANIAYIGFSSAYPFSIGFAYSGITGPSSFGSGSDFFLTGASSGTIFSVVGNDFGTGAFLSVDPNYTSGSAISSTETFSNLTFASAGITPGPYIYTLPNDTITINFGSVEGVVPEPSTWAMMLVGFSALGFALHRNSKRLLALA